MRSQEMQWRRFEAWLDTVRGLDARTIGSRISNCKRVERYEGDLETQFRADGLVSLMERLTYSKDDVQYRRMPRHKVPINGNPYTGTATLKSAVSLYRDFRSSSDSKSGRGLFGRWLRREPSLRPKQSVRRTAAANWPNWPEPSDESLLELARVLAPLIRFLNPEIVAAVAEDNRRFRKDWSLRFNKLGIDPEIYLWDGSPCAFPGVRRYAGSKEIAEFRQHSTPDTVPSQCLTLDDNDYPKHLWAFVFTGKPFRKKGPEGYQLGHLVDHKEHGNRWREELTLVGRAEEPLPLFGLFTSAANAAYVPSAFLRPTDFSFRLRGLVQRRARHLYGGVCRILPPSLDVTACDDPPWDLDRFDWGEPVGEMTRIPTFLDFRRERIDELFDKRRAVPG